MLLPLESVVLLVNGIDAAVPWYATLLGTPVEHEDPRSTFVRAPHGVISGFHPNDAKVPGGEPGTTPYWEVADIDSARPLRWRVAPRWTAAPPSQASARAWRH